MGRRTARLLLQTRGRIRQLSAARALVQLEGAAGSARFRQVVRGTRTGATRRASGSFIQTHNGAAATQEARFERGGSARPRARYGVAPGRSMFSDVGVGNFAASETAHCLPWPRPRPGNRKGDITAAVSPLPRQLATRRVLSQKKCVEDVFGRPRSRSFRDT